jgi:Uma2 family endonuclease
VLSPDDRPKEVAWKVQDYLAASAAMVWVVNPKNRTVTVHRPMVGPRVLRRADTLDGATVLPGFKCKVSQIFA